MTDKNYSKIRSVNSKTQLVSIDKFEYQGNLTKKLDSLSGDFDEIVLNQIVLWKVNRYPLICDSTISVLNKIGDKQSNFSLDNEKDREIASKALKLLLKSNGVKLAMASTILRFKNPNWFQIFDERVCRALYGKKPNEAFSCFKAKEGRTNATIEFYFKYLKDLKNRAKELDVEYSMADRVFWLTDKKLNKGIKLSNHSL